MQCVEGCHPRASSILLGQLDTAFKCYFWKANFGPQAIFAMKRKFVADGLHLTSRNLFLKQTSRDGALPFRTMQRCKPNTAMPLQQSPRDPEVLVRYVEGN